MIRLIFIALLLFAINANASVILRDNFDTCTTGCTAAVGSPPNVSSPNTADWWNWGTDQTSGTYNSVTKPSGEITSTGRGGTGKSLKLWRAGANFKGSASYSGSLYTTSPGSYSDFYMRFYAKIPSEMSIPHDTKMWRFNTSSGGEIFINFMGGGSNTFLWLWGGTGDSDVNTTFLSSSQVASLRDGNWHCWQFRFNLSTGTVTFWADGTQLASLTDSRLQQGSWSSYFQHFPLGNSQGADWQASWQAFEVDDLIIATTKAETDPESAPTSSLPIGGGVMAIGTGTTPIQLQ